MSKARRANPGLASFGKSASRSVKAVRGRFEGAAIIGSIEMSAKHKTETPYSKESGHLGDAIESGIVGNSQKGPAHE